MFGFGNKKESYELLAVVNGKTVDISSLPDEVFSKKILGDGYAIEPSDGIILSPVNGKIVDVQGTHHAYGIETSDGINILVHIGIDTVSMSGDGFKSFVKNGEKVKAGDKLAEANLDMIKEAGFPTYTIVLITNMDDIKSINVRDTDTKAGETVVMTYEKKGE